MYEGYSLQGNREDNTITVWYTGCPRKRGTYVSNFCSTCGIAKKCHLRILYHFKRRDKMASQPCKGDWKLIVPSNTRRLIDRIRNLFCSNTIIMVPKNPFITFFILKTTCQRPICISWHSFKPANWEAFIFFFVN